MMSVSEGPGLGVWDMAPRTGIPLSKHSDEEEQGDLVSLHGAGLWGASPWSGPADLCIGITGALVKMLLLIQSVWVKPTILHFQLAPRLGQSHWSMDHTSIPSSLGSPSGATGEVGVTTSLNWTKVDVKNTSN